jgi:hypothetical protein
VEPPAEPERLRHNPRNAVTATVERIRQPDGTSVVRKAIRAFDPDAVDFWQASSDPRHWNYWRREIEAYQSSELQASLDGTGLAMAAADIDDHGDRAVLTLEDVEGTHGHGFSLEDHAAVGRAVGRWQAQPPLDLRWLSQRFLRDYSNSKPVPYDLVEDDRPWQHPLITRHWPPGIREAWRRLYAARELLLGVMERLPRVTAHLDLWVSNEIRRPSGEVVLLDWSFTGDGAVGEDLGNHCPDSAFDLFWPSARLPELDQTVFEAYLEGLREGGSKVDPKVVRLGMTAASVKYVWLLPLTLASLDLEEQRAYHEPVDADALMAERGIAMQFLLGWADEALGLADDLHLT